MAAITQPVLAASYAVKTINIPGLSKGLTDKIPMLSRLGLAPVDTAGTGTIQWYDDINALQVMYPSAALTNTTTSTSLVVANLYISKGDILKITSPLNGREDVLVTSITTSTRTCVITREYNGTTKLALSVTSTVHVIGNINTQGSAYARSASSKITTVTNVMTNTRRSAIVSKSIASVSNYTGVGSLTNEIAKQQDAELMEIERLLIESKTAVTTTSSVRGRSKGIKGFFTTNACSILTSLVTGTTTSTSTTLTKDKLNRFFGLLKDQEGGDYYNFYCGGTMYGAVQDAMGAAITEMIVTGVNGATAGEHYKTFITSRGQNVALILDPNMTAGDGIAIEVNAGENSGVWFCPSPRFLEESDIANTEDTVGKYIVTEWSVMVRREWQQGYIYGVTAGG